MGERVLRYLMSLLYGVVLMMILLTWNATSGWMWKVSVTPYTAWIFLSWLLCYPWLRGKLGYLFIKNKNSGLISKGITSYPWQYALGSTRSVGEIFSLIYVLCEHLLISFLLILSGPLVTCMLLAIALFKKRLWLFDRNPIRRCYSCATRKWVLSDEAQQPSVNAFPLECDSSASPIGAGTKWTPNWWLMNITKLAQHVT